MSNAMVLWVSQCFNRSPTTATFKVNKWFIWQHLVWRSAGQDTSQHATPYVYNWYGELLDLCWFHLNCKPKYTKTISEACTEWCGSIPHLKIRTCMHCREENYHGKKLNLQRHVHLLLGVTPSCHSKLAWVPLCLTLCAWIGETCLGGHRFDSIN